MYEFFPVFAVNFFYYYQKIDVYLDSWNNESIHELECFWTTWPNEAFRIQARKHVRVTQVN